MLSWQDSCYFCRPAEIEERLSLVFEHGLNGARFVAGFERLALVIVLFAFTDGDANFNEPAAGQYLQWNDTAALLFGFDQLFDLALFGEQLAAARLRDFVDGHAAGAANARVQQPQLAAFERDVRTAQLAVTHAQRFGFGAGQLQARHQTVTEFIIVAGTAIRNLLGCRLFLLHYL